MYFGPSVVHALIVAECSGHYHPDLEVVVDPRILDPSNTMRLQKLLDWAECVRTNVVRALADVVATKLGIIGANVVRAHARFPCGGRRSGH